MVFISVSLASVILSLGVSIYSIYNNKVQKSAYFNLLNLAILITLLGNYVEAASRTAEGSMVGVEVAYLGQPFIPVLWYLCILEFCGMVRTRLRVFGLLLIPVAITCLAFTWEYNHLLYKSARYLAEDHFGQLRFESGPLYFVKPLYLWAFIAVGIGTIIVKYLNPLPAEAGRFLLRLKSQFRLKPVAMRLKPAEATAHRRLCGTHHREAYPGVQCNP